MYVAIFPLTSSSRPTGISMQVTFASSYGGRYELYPCPSTGRGDTDFACQTPTDKKRASTAGEMYVIRAGSSDFGVGFCSHDEAVAAAAAAASNEESKGNTGEHACPNPPHTFYCHNTSPRTLTDAVRSFMRQQPFTLNCSYPTLPRILLERGGNPTEAR